MSETWHIKTITDPLEMYRISGSVLRRLTKWFGSDYDIENFQNGVYKCRFAAAFPDNGEAADADACAGFIAGKIHYRRTGDIYVCGVDPAWQGRGVGSALYRELETWFAENGCSCVMVKTISDTREADYPFQDPYEATRAFYRKNGFLELVTLKEMWDAENQCLIMLKRLAGAPSQAAPAAEDFPVTGADCAACRYCCEFDASDIWELPHIDGDMEARIAAKFAESGKTPPRYQEADGEGRPVRGGTSRPKRVFEVTYDSKGDFRCPLYDAGSGCIMGGGKPYDCAVWPFRPMRLGDRVVVTVSPLCAPAMQKTAAALKRMIFSEFGDILVKYGTEHFNRLKDYVGGYPILRTDRP